MNNYEKTWLIIKKIVDIDSIKIDFNTCAGRMAVVNDLLRTEIDGEPVEPLITKEQAIKLLDNEDMNETNNR